MLLKLKQESSLIKAIGFSPRNVKYVKFLLRNSKKETITGESDLR
jgi:hypothetical protein